MKKAVPRPKITLSRGPRRRLSSNPKGFLVAGGVCLILVLMIYLLADDLDSTDALRLQNLSGTKAGKEATATVGYAISLVKCGDKQSSAAGLTDAALVMRHSIHMQSIRNPSSGSQYDYKMYAIVHRQAEPCSQVLKDAGFHIELVDPPVDPTMIEGDFLRKHIHKEWCCGSDEFIKLYAYNLPEPVIVHVDIDFAFYKPMDNLYDAILFHKDSERGRAARAKLELDRPNQSLPDEIGAFIVKDWPQVIPGRKAMYQAGFLVAKRDPSIVEEIKKVILEGNYVEGYGRNNGWGGQGYGGLVGGMAMQGLMAYFYDVVRPNNAVDLNGCRYNHMGMDIRYRHHPNFMKNRKDIFGKCRDSAKGDDCEDCMVTPVADIYNVHYTQCRKPWNCIGQGTPGGRKHKPADSIDTNAGDLVHCLELIGMWHSMRTDLETKLWDLTQDETIRTGHDGKYKEAIFHGHCDGEGGASYKTIQAKPETLRRITELYE